MALDDFLRECMSKGKTPLHYKRTAVYVDGSQVTESFESRQYREMQRAEERIRDMIGLNQGRNMAGSLNRRNEGIDKAVSGLYGSDVVIRTEKGYHYGRLESYDGSFFHLKSYCFSTRLMNSFDYSSESIFSGDAAVPADGIAFVKEIPDTLGFGAMPGDSDQGF